MSTRMETQTYDEPEDSWSEDWPEGEIVEPLMLFGGFEDNEKAKMKDRVIIYLLQKFFQDRDADDSRYRCALTNLVEAGILSMDSFASFGKQDSSSLAKAIHLSSTVDLEKQTAVVKAAPEQSPAEERATDLLSDRFLSDFQPMALLGAGGFGTVYKVLHNIDGKFYAVKQIPFETSAQSNVLEESVFREVKALAQMDHPFICRYYNAWVEKGYQPLKGARVPSAKRDSTTAGVPVPIPEDPSRALVQLNDFNSDAGMIAQYWANIKLKRTLYLQTEYCGDKTLAHYIANHEQSYRLFTQVICGVSYIHGNGFIHRDLKPENIFVTDDGCAKIGDFGLAKSVMDASAGTLGLEVRHSVGVGTMGYTAPECDISGDYGQKADIYALGIILWEILCGGFEFAQERQAELTKLLSGQISPEVMARDPEGAKLCLRMISKTPESRPSITGIMNTPWFQRHMQKLMDAKTQRTPLLESSSPATTIVESPRDGERSNESLIQELNLMKQRSLKIEKELQKRGTLEEVSDDNKENMTEKVVG